MEREVMVHWIENSLFTCGGKADVDIRVAYDDVKYDVVDRLTFYSGDEVMVHLVNADEAVPLSRLTGDSVYQIFKGIVE